MTRGRRIVEAVHVAVLGVWAGALVLGGAAAAIVFPVMKNLDPKLPTFAKYDGPHWMLAGGQVGQRVFFVLDVVQFACVILSGATLVLALVKFGLNVRRVSTFVRVAVLLGLIGVLAYRLGFLEPRMQEALKSYWAAAQAGDNEGAARFRAVFDGGHPIETTLMSVTLGLVVAGLIAAVWSVAGSDVVVERAVRRGAELEVPMLARKR